MAVKSRVDAGAERPSENRSALEFPDTALEILYRETVHLEFNAFEIPAHGLSLNRSDITSSFDIDILELYRRKQETRIDAIPRRESRHSD